MQRRTFLTGAALAAVAIPGRAQTSPQGELVGIEASSGGRLGVFAVDTHSGRHIGHRENERFAMCSTFKVLAVSAVLARVDAGAERLGRSIAYSKSDLLEYAPVTTKNVADGSMTSGDLCAAAIEYSDNTAANLLLASLGGPIAVTRFARGLGDTITRLDRTEPALNTAIAGDPRDTTSPASMARDLQALLLGNALSDASRAHLKAWMLACRTGGDRIRAGVPATWKVADKTGSGSNNTSNDIAVIWPPNRAPIVLTVYLTNATASSEARNAAIARVTKVVRSAF